MRRKHLLPVFAVFLLAFFSTTISAQQQDEQEQDTDTRMINAKVVEVNDDHFSVVARSGVEHVIAVSKTETKVTISGREVSFKDLRVKDIVTVELDARKPVKFAKSISMRSEQSQVARNRQN